MDSLERKIQQLEIEREAFKREKDKSRVENLSRQIADLEDEHKQLMANWVEEKSTVESIQKVKQELEELRYKASRAEREGELGLVAEIRYGQLPAAEEELKTAIEKLKEYEQNGKRLVREEITAEDIAEVVSRWTGIPVHRMLQSDRAKLLDIENELHKRVLGQEDAIKAVSSAIRRSRTGLSDDQRPIGSFLFLGPTGTGKTYLPKLLAEFLFDDKNAMVRLDMSEFMESHSVAKMIGAPPGYVGYEAGGVLTEAVRRKPFSIVLFDEVEKAHPEIFNILLQLLDDGRLTDGQSRTVDFSNTIVILTSNYAADLILDADREGQEVDMDEVRAFLFTKFRPEFLNRLNDIIIYHTFTPEQVERIVELEFAGLVGMLDDQNITATLSDEARKKLAREGYTFELGARPLQRIIEKEIITRLSVDIITGTVKTGDRVNITVKGDEFAFAVER
jgi:ATP-dependent Clp protease ATP-binding subunit ClpB